LGASCTFQGGGKDIEFPLSLVRKFLKPHSRELPRETKRSQKTGYTRLRKFSLVQFISLGFLQPTEPESKKEKL
jgi:hypothetical protein